MRHDQLRRFLSHAHRVLHDGTERGTMQMIEVSVRDQHQVNRRKVANLHARLAQSLQQEKPTREIWINQNVLAAHLDKETRMPDECQAQIAVRYKLWFTSFTRARSHHGVADQSGELAGSFT